jgi:hypothetical protein
MTMRYEQLYDNKSKKHQTMPFDGIALPKVVRERTLARSEHY